MSALDDLRNKKVNTQLELCILYWGDPVSASDENIEEAEQAATELLALRSELADAKARAKTAEENWHKNEARVAKLANAARLVLEWHDEDLSDGVQRAYVIHELRKALVGAE